MEKYKNKYRIPSARLQNWDYGTNAPYFVTICTAHREHYFGDIVETQFIASELGKLAQKHWHEIPEHFPFVELCEFVVMPNHVHGIIIINKNDDNRDCRDAINRDCRDAINRDCRDAINRVSTVTNNNNTGGITGNKNPMLHDNLSRIVRWYKGRCSFEIRKIHADFAWQSRFHDHIIRNNKSFQRIEEYILTNPQQWEKDKFYVKAI